MFNLVRAMCRTSGRPKWLGAGKVGSDQSRRSQFRKCASRVFRKCASRKGLDAPIPTVPAPADHNAVVRRSHFRKYAAGLVRNGPDSELGSRSIRREATQRIFSEAAFYSREHR